MPTKKILKKKHTHYHKDLPVQAGGTIWAKPARPHDSSGAGGGFMAGGYGII